VGFQFPAITPYFLKGTHRRSAQSQFRPKAPPEYTTDQPNSPFETALREVRYISDHRTDAQITTANLWNARGPGYWAEEAAVFIDERHLDERAASHIHALMFASLMDAAIGCWEAKFHYLFLRPIMADAGIHLVFAMPNHPTYPSGHSCLSASAATVLSLYFPSHAKELDAQVVDAGWSRIYAGIHYSFDIEAGQKLGRSTAEWAISYDRRRGLLSAVGLGEREEGEHEHR
jgi:membrane-associated phospholipid phosphatase